MTNTELDRSITTAELSVQKAEDSFGRDNVVVAERLMKLTALLRQKNRLLDAINAEARARVIWEKNNCVVGARAVMSSDNTPPQEAAAASFESSIQSMLSSGSLTIKSLSIVWWLVLILASPVLLPLGFYFLPTLIAGRKRKKNADAVFILNFLLGWTVIGWVIALVWASANDATGLPSTAGENSDIKACPDCAENVKALAKKCRFCGYSFEH
jgi:hypothetical protein